MSSVGIYYEEEPTVKEWIKESWPSGRAARRHVFTVFPILTWISHYNLQWLIGDLISGITVGAMLVPQSMAYASLAGLAPQYGLFSALAGGITYWLVGTAKDISIGPEAVMSLFVGEVARELRVEHPEWQPHIIASVLALMAGVASASLGLLRLGWVVDFVSHTAISAYTTGAAITIIVSQVPALTGLRKAKGDAPYETIINCFQKIKQIKLDAAIGVSALIVLYTIRYTTERMARRTPSARRKWSLISSLRSVFVILLFTLIGFLVNRNRMSDPAFRMAGHVPPGFGDMGVPIIEKGMVAKLVDYLPITLLILLLEHVAVAKSFGRLAQYTIDPSQEMLAVGLANIVGSFFGAFPGAGSFSRTAVNSKAGVRTPLSGVITSLFVIMAVYALPAMFAFIPRASLAAVIIHAVGDLITPPSVVKHFWKVSPIEVVMFGMSIVVMIFVSIEDGIYAAIASSLAILLIRMAQSKGSSMGMVEVSPVLGQHLPKERSDSGPDMSVESLIGQMILKKTESNTVSKIHPARSVFLPMDHSDGSNPDVAVRHPFPGVFIFRMTEGFAYPNANRCSTNLLETVYKDTRQTEMIEYKPGEMNWNEVESFNKRSKRSDNDLPTLRAIIVDMSAVNNVDISSVHALVETRETLDRYAAPNKVQWHFSTIYNRWTKRALVSSGFGRATMHDPSEPEPLWRPLFNVTDLDGEMIDDDEQNKKATMVSETQKTEFTINDDGTQTPPVQTMTQRRGTIERQRSPGPKSLLGMNTPFFHVDVLSAVQSVIHNLGVAEARFPDEAV